MNNSRGASDVNEAHLDLTDDKTPAISLVFNFKIIVLEFLDKIITNGEIVSWRDLK
jgi:hypothetical protein